MKTFDRYCVFKFLFLAIFFSSECMQTDCVTDTLEELSETESQQDSLEDNDSILKVKQVSTLCTQGQKGSSANCVHKVKRVAQQTLKFTIKVKLSNI